MFREEAPRANAVSGPRERREPAERRAGDRAGDSEGRSPSDNYETAANVVMIAAAAAAAVYVLRTPPLRRAAWRLLRSWAAGPAVVWTVNLVRQSWDASKAA